MKTKYRIQSNNKFRLTKVRKSYLKPPSHAKNKSKTKTNQNKKRSKTTKSNIKKLRWVYLRVFSRLIAQTFLKITLTFSDSNFIGIFSANNFYPIVKSDNYCLLIQDKNSYLYVNVSPMQVYLIQRNGFLSQTFDDNFLSFLKHLSSTRTVYANPPSLSKETDGLRFCVLFHHLFKSNKCFHQTCNQLSTL